ncbi:MAG TPA: MOSC domain-containing protein [Terriglobia bacterium]|nr:MOSC domain-containing protein [Terriglobia bacterium]
MKLISINIGVPREVLAGQREVETAIFKIPVSGPVKAGRLNLDGDRQADLSVHGGEFKAVYAYSQDNIEYWKKFLKRDDLHPGSFGENLTVEGMLDHEVRIGDELEIGTARFRVTQPRFPCYKLGIAMGSSKFVQTFDDAGRNGFYLSVAQEGVITPGDEIRISPGANPQTITIAQFADVHRDGNSTGQKMTSGMIRRMLARGETLKSIKSGGK